MSGDMSMGGGVSLASRGLGTPSRELERVVARPELRVLHFQLREAALELRDARAERRDLGLAFVVALGGFGLGQYSSAEVFFTPLSKLASSIVIGRKAE